MKMSKVLARAPMTYVAYVFLLMGFVMLGTFVYALAAESAVAGVIGGSLVAFFAASIVGFRIGARNRAESNDSGIPIEGANIWAQPLRRDQIDRYLSSYRGAQDDVQEPRVMAIESGASIDRQAA